MKFEYTPKALKIPTDYLNGENTAILGNEAIGALLRLALVATGSPSCSLPDDDGKLAAISRLGPDWPKHSAGIRACLEPDPDDPSRVILPMAYADRQEYESWCLKSAKGGRSKRKPGRRVVEPPSKGGASPPTFLPTYPPTNPPSSSGEKGFASEPREEEKDDDEDHPQDRPRGPPTGGGRRRRIGDGDLENDARLEELYQGAVKAGKVRDSEAGRLRYFAAAAHALRKAKPGTAGNMFAALVTGTLKDQVISDEDEDGARKRLKALAAGPGPVLPVVVVRGFDDPKPPPRPLAAPGKAPAGRIDKADLDAFREGIQAMPEAEAEALAVAVGGDRGGRTAREYLAWRPMAAFQAATKLGEATTAREPST